MWQGGMHGKEGMCGRGGMHGRGACMTGGHAWQGCVCHACPPQTLRDTVGKCAGGTHPTGMYSCLYLKLLFLGFSGVVVNWYVKQRGLQ